MIHRNIVDIIGNTPLIEIDGIYAKLETTNPTGSIKDRMVWYMVKKAEAKGELKPGAKIIEATSGNTGIAFAMISALRGYKFIAVMPESMSIERRRMIERFGGKIVLTPAKDDMAGAVKKYQELARKNKNAWFPRQFENNDNIEAHRLGIGQEILKQIDEKIDAFVAGVGTGGTLIGAALALKKKNPGVKIVAVEPAESAVLSGKKPGLHKIQGIGEGFIPKLIQNNLRVINEIVVISGQKAIAMSEKLAKDYGILAGISSGANFWAAKQIKKKYNFRTVVTVLPDRGERYLNG